eukprot:TRINITY_DN2766_c0_g1_i1.p1 TRINITY_DN2766_c0_g1~~TRINITY_DN2766_c0_g1_i1.p1  ORF type:complete len:618 (-),score=135.32 TRINITY_DN2766_c0_g1_i1:570-2423(-)
MQCTTPLSPRLDPASVEPHLDALEMLKKQFPTVAAADNEIIKLQSVLTLPKGTEHFMSDIHGEYEAFCHFLRNGSGVIRVKIDELFSTKLNDEERKQLAFIVYYPEQKVPMLLQSVQDQTLFFKTTLTRLVQLTRYIGTKYSQSRIRKAIPAAQRAIISELLYEASEARKFYFDGIVHSVIELGEALTFIAALAETIRVLAVEHLHVLGDIFDRGPGADIILDRLLQYDRDALDIVWGNHEITWLGAASGCAALMCHVLRVSLSYNNLDTIESAYGINMLPLATFAMETYSSDECHKFLPKLPAVAPEDESYVKASTSIPTPQQLKLIAKMNKAITIILFKLEAQIIHRRPQFMMEHRLMLHTVDVKHGTIEVANETCHLVDTFFPTVDLSCPGGEVCHCEFCTDQTAPTVTFCGKPIPQEKRTLPSAYRLTPAEQVVVDQLLFAFRTSSRLQKHARFLLDKGSIYVRYNGNLLIHGCVPLDESGELLRLNIEGSEYCGRQLMDRNEQLVRACYFLPESHPRKCYSQDAMWYMWVGAHSPLFGRQKMSTFERLFIEEEKTWAEPYTPYYRFRDDVAAVSRILENFNLDSSTGHIINGVAAMPHASKSFHSSEQATYL